MPTYAPGWYHDGTAPGQQRYHDGEQWTSYVFVPGATNRKPPPFKPSRQLASATYRMLFADRAMILALGAAAILGTLLMFAIALPAAYWGHILPTSRAGIRGVLVLAALGLVGNVVSVFASGLVVAAAVLRAEGRPATVVAAWQLTWRRRRQLLAWAVLSTVIGTLVRTLERFGIGGVIATWVLGLGWAVATVFAVPVVMVEGTMPVATVKRSAGVLRGCFTVTIISRLRMALPWLVLAWAAVFVMVVGVVTLLSASGPAAAVGALVIVAGLCAFFLVGIVSTAVGVYMQTLLYRYANGLPTPGVDQQLFPPLAPTA